MGRKTEARGDTKGAQEADPDRQEYPGAGGGLAPSRPLATRRPSAGSLHSLPAALYSLVLWQGMEGIERAMMAFKAKEGTHPSLVAFWMAYLASVRRVALEATAQAETALREMQERPDLPPQTIAAIVALGNSA